MFQYGIEHRVADEARHHRRLQLGLADHHLHRIDRLAVLVHPQRGAGGVDQDVAAHRHRRDRAHAREVGPHLPPLILGEARILHRVAQRRVERVHPAHLGDVVLEPVGRGRGGLERGKRGRHHRRERRRFRRSSLRARPRASRGHKPQTRSTAPTSALATSSVSPRRAFSTRLASRSNLIVFGSTPSNCAVRKWCISIEAAPEGRPNSLSHSGWLPRAA